MKRLIFIASLLLVGCSDPQPQPTFNPNYKHIIMVDGEYFRIPYGASNMRSKRYNNSKKHLKIINDLKRHSMICNIGDIMWMENNSISAVANYHKAYGREAAFKYMKNMVWSKGKGSCISPLNEKEYKFYRSKEIEYNASRIASLQAQANIMQAYTQSITPRRVNVNLTGNINHNIRYDY